MADKDDILTRAMELPPNERAEVAALLLDSLEEGEDDLEAISEEWAQVAARRVQKFESGQSKGLDAFEVMRQEREALLKRLGRK